ncbi:MAG TPA: hypothetical protein VLA93_06475 [Pyrinomonadaceae bacterium]|nr:hypothetical protein [Pyrinomonadaceae bacterium]
MRFSIAKAIGYGVLIWVVGFIWGSIVFMTPALKSTPAIPYVSSNPAISFPIIVFWIPLTYLLARQFLKNSRTPEADGIKLGLVFSEVNFVLDVIILVILLKAGIIYFTNFSIWLAYAMLFVIPWLTGRSLAKAIVD